MNDKHKDFFRRECDSLWEKIQDLNVAIVENRKNLEGCQKKRDEFCRRLHQLKENIDWVQPEERKR